MSLVDKKSYKYRLLDDKIEKYLKIFGAISIEGPKWCGKTWTSLNHAKSATYVTEQEIKELARTNPKYIFNNKYPQLIDEWQLVPQIWDSVRNECDRTTEKGKFILTGSTTLSKEDKEEKVYHSGTGRIIPLKMYTMSLYESKDSNGEVSIMDMYQNKVNCKYVGEIDLRHIAELIIRGGWPTNIDTPIEDIGIIPKSYINSVITTDIHERKDKKRDSNKMKMILKSLARNESSIISQEKIIKDIADTENENEKIESRQLVSDYISTLDSLYLTTYQEGYSLNYRSSKRIGKSPKRHLIDPSLSCALLDLTVDKLMLDFNTFGLMFEALVERDLKIYMEYLNGNLYHFRDNTSGDEVDAILEFEDGEYAAVEIKLTHNGVEDAKKTLMNFYKNVPKKPKFMCIIVGYYQAIVKDEETNIYIIPITTLKP